MKYSSVFIPKTLKNKVEICCLLERLSIQDFMDEAVDQFLDRRGMTYNVNSILAKQKEYGKGE